MVQTRPRAKLNIPHLLGIVAAGLALLTSLFLALWPTYTGESASAEAGGQVVHRTATLIEINGYWVISLLVLPLVLAVAAVLAIRMLDYRTTWGKIAIWMPTVILWLFVAAGSRSIGLLYLPAAAVLLAAAITFSRRRTGEQNTTKSAG